MWEAWVENWANSRKDIRYNNFLDYRYHTLLVNSPANCVICTI